MDGFTGFKTAAEELPAATAVMDPFHVVRLAGDALDRCRRRVQLAIHGHRGMKNDPLYSARRTHAHRCRAAHRQAGRSLGRMLKKRAADVLAYFDRPGSSNGPTEAINGRLEHLRGSALGFRSLTNYSARSLLETGGFRPQLHPRS
jgi:transposase